MVIRSKGPRSKTRYKLQKRIRDRGMPPVTHSLRSFQEGDMVGIKINPSVHGGQPHPRFHGFTGKVVGRQGNAYVVAVKDGGKAKELLVRAEHLKA